MNKEKEKVYKHGWIAKNCITGKTYGKSYSSIYDCQKFIDTELCILEYEMRRCFSCEKYILARISNKGKSIIEIIGDSLKEFEEESSIKDYCEIIAKGIINKKSQKDIDDELESLSNTRWQKNNIIRCYYLDQDRFADGFDF